MFQLLLLGEPVLLDAAGDAVPVWRPALALLALAAAHDSGVPRERAAGLLWPDMDEARARGALRQVLFRVRHDVGELLVGGRTTVQLNARCVVTDVVLLERDLAAGNMAAAAERYRGELLAGFSLPGSAAFDQWADAWRQRLRAGMAAALDDLVDAALADADWTEALRRAQQRLDVEPLSEQAAERVITLHHQCGDRGRALALYDSIAARFIAELGVPPSGRLAAVAHRIRTTSGGQAATAPGRSASLPGGSPAAADAVFQLPLVGRSAEFEELTRRWNAASGGSRHVVVIGGQEGVGKTRLADDFRRWVVTRGATTLWSRAYEIERQIPYATLAGVLRDALHAPGLAGIDDRSPVEIGRIVPEFARRFPGTKPAANEVASDADRLRMLEAVRDVIDNLAYEAPLLLVVDDVQWADEASLAVLNYLCRTLQGSPLLLLLTARTAELTPSDPTTRLLHGLMREAGSAVCQLSLEPLDEAAIREALVRLGIAPDDGDLRPATLLRETGGNALFLTELLRAVNSGAAAAASSARRSRTEGTARNRLSALAADQLQRLPTGALRLLEVAAVLGRQFPLRLAAEVADLDTAAAADAIDVLLRRGLLRQVEYGYDFSHGLLRRETLDGLGAARTVELHAAIYARLEPAAASDSAAISVERAHGLAHHAARGGLREDAHRWYLATADRAIRLYAHEEAAAALQSALEHAGDREAERAVQVQIARLAWITSDYSGAARACRRALDLSSDADERLSLRIRMLDAGLRGGVLEWRDAESVAPQLLEEAAAAGPHRQRDLLVALADACARAQRWAEALDYARRAVDAARSAAEPDRLVNALLLLARLTARTPHTSAPLDCLDEALEVARAHDLERESLDARIERGTELSRIGRWDDAIGELRAARAGAARAGEAGAEVVAAINLSDLLVRRGRWNDAEEVLAVGARLATRHDFPHADAALRLNHVLLKWLRGDSAAAVMEASGSVAACAAAAGLHAVERVAYALMVLSRLGDGDLAGARADAERMDALVTAAHANWADDHELAVVARSRLARATSSGRDMLTLVEEALTGAASACGSALLRLELAHLSRPYDAARASRLEADAVRALEELGATPFARRLASPPSP